MSGWLETSPATLVSPLSPAVRREVEAYRDPSGAPARNDLRAAESLIQYVPMGIDDRAGPHLLRAARRKRTQHGAPADAIVIGHFGLILDAHKMLRRAVETYVSIASEAGWSLGGRPLYLWLSGSVVDAALVTDIQARFHASGMDDRLIVSTPVLEADFDAEMRTCDSVFCFRVQAWGQQSHVLVRALSLGLPVMVNTASGWGYDPETTIADDDLAGGMRRVLAHVASPAVEQLRRKARAAFEHTHRAEGALQEMIAIGRANAAAQ